MVARIAFLCVSACLVSSSSAALELVWPSGSKDLVLTETRACTLLVRAGPEEPGLPDEWHLVWAAESDSADPIVAVSVPQVDASFADPCVLLPARSVASLIARVDTTLHCGAPGIGRAHTARHVFRLAAGTRARLRLVVPGPGVVTPAVEASINGGGELRIPPLVVRADIAILDEHVQVSFVGTSLSSVDAAEFLPGGSTQRQTLEILDRSGAVIVARMPLSSSFAFGGIFLLAAPDGFAAYRLAPGLATAQTPDGPALLLIRLAPESLSLPDGATGAEPQNCSYGAAELRDSLLAIGVSWLERLDPRGPRERQSATNLIGEPISPPTLDDIYMVSISGHPSLDHAAQRLAALPAVRALAAERARPAADFVPNDFLFPEQWNVRSLDGDICGVPTFDDIDSNLDLAWDRTTGSPSVSIAILDTGIDPTHEDLAPRVRLGASFDPLSLESSADDLGHGTAVAGIAGATGNNTVGVAGASGSVPMSVEKSGGASSDGIVLEIGFVGSPYRHELEVA